MKTIKAVYGCSYCGFTSESPKIVGKHEYNCENNPKMPSREDSFKAQKAHKRKQMLEAKSISEMNELLKDYINSYYKETSFSNISNHNIGYYWSGAFKIDNYQLKNYYSNELKTLGISTNIADYPNLLELVTEMKELNAMSGNYSKLFKTHLNSELKKFQKSDEFKEIEHNIMLLSDEINKLSNLRNEDKIKLENLENNYILEVKEKYNYIDYNTKVKEIRKILGIKG